MTESGLVNSSFASLMRLTVEVAECEFHSLILAIIRCFYSDECRTNDLNYDENMLRFSHKIAILY